MVLLCSEIQNGVLTHDIGFMNLKVVTASFWKKSDRVETPDDFIDTVLNDPGIV